MNRLTELWRGLRRGLWRDLWPAHKAAVLTAAGTFVVGLLVLVIALVLSRPAPQDLTRGKLVVFRATPQSIARCGAEPGSYHIARLIGLPGDDVVVSVGGAVSVDGQVLAEPYVRNPPEQPGHIQPPSGEWKLKDGQYFLLDDNRTQGCDSRSFGPVPSDALKR